MIQNSQEGQIWFEHLKGIFGRPAPNKHEIRADGSVFARSLGMCCPNCGDAFFTYQREGIDRQPYLVDEYPPDGLGTRQTCGSPLCWEAEDDCQFKRRLECRKAATARAKVPVQKPKIETLLL